MAAVTLPHADTGCQAHARFITDALPFGHMQTYQNAWSYIGFGVFTLLLALNLVQYAEPATSLVALLLAGGTGLIVEGIKRRNRWLAAEQAARRRFSF